MNIVAKLVAVVLCTFAHTGYALDRTETGFYYPLGVENFSQATCGTWLGRDRAHGGCYFDNFYHDGIDMMTDSGSGVYAIADGEIAFSSPNGWTGPKTCTNKDESKNKDCRNIGLVIQHWRSDGTTFYAVYGHLLKEDVSKTSGHVNATDFLGNVGPWDYGDHLHFGISETRPTDHLGLIPDSNWPEKFGFVDPVKFLNSHHPATLIPKGTQDFYRGGDYIYQGSDLCATANARFKIVDGSRSDSWVTKEVSQSEACPGIEKAIESTLQSVKDNGGVVKVGDIVDVKRAPWWSSWLSSLSSIWHSLFGLVQTPAALAADPSVQRDLAVHNIGEVYEIQGTNKQVVILTDGPGMNGDKAIDLGSYAESDPAETFAPITGDNVSGKQSDLVVTKLWTERSSGHVWDTIGFGDTVCMVAESKNAGNKDVSRDVKITFYVSKGRREDKHPDPVGSEMIPAKYLSKARTAKATTKHCVNIHGDNYPSGYPGIFNFGVHIDPDNKEPESNEKNNWKGEQIFTLTENPHLSISQLWFSNPAAQPGEGVTAYVRIRNSGTPFGSDKVNTEWRVQGPQYGPDPIVIGFDQTRHDHLRTNDEAQEEVSFVMPTMPGDYVFSAEVDYDFRTAQSDRSVMTASISFTISEPENDDIEDGTLVDPNAPIACPLITPDTWEKWSVQPYSPPFDWFSGNRLVISPICSPNQPDMLDLIFGTEGDPNVIVYKTVYVRNSKTRVDTTLTVECSEGELWGDYCQGGAKLSVSGAQVDTSSVVQPMLILAYTCHQVDGVWKCGCKDVTCTVQGYQQQAAAIAH